MKLLGERNWWAPAPLRRFHKRFGLHEAPSPAAHSTEIAIDLSQTTEKAEPEVEGEPVGASGR
jgi:RND superfamily putative drug exporter